MYYNLLAEQELGFDAFIAPDDFNRTAQPVDIYEVFKREYALNSQARYIYYYSDGNYPLTLTPTASEYYRYGYTTGGTEVIVDVPLNGTAVTIFNETTSTKRWVVVYRPSTAKFNINLKPIKYLIWIYCGNYIDAIYTGNTTYNEYVLSLKYIHYANLNTLTQFINNCFWTQSAPLLGTMTFPETMTQLGTDSYSELYSVTKCFLPNTKNIVVRNSVLDGSLPLSLRELNYGASTSIPVTSTEIDAYPNLKVISVSAQNTQYASLNNCDIIYNKSLTTLVYIAPKTVRGLTLPDQLPQEQITALGTKLSANIMQGYQLYIGTLITDLTNLYLSNKSFSTIGVGVGNTAFVASGNMLFNAAQTSLIKAGTSNTGDLIIPNVQTIEANCFLRCTGYTGNLTIPSSVTAIVANNFNGLSGLTGSLVIGSGLTTIPANAFAGLTALTGNLTIPNTVTSIAAGVFSGLTNLTSLTLPVGYDTVVYRNFSFANFSSDSLNTAILNLANGTAGSPKYFYISKTSLDALNVAYPNAVSNATARYINVYANVIQDSSLKLWLDAGNTLSYPGSGTVWNDLSGNGNNGTLVNGVAYSTANGGVMSFDGVNDYVNLGNKFNLNTDITFSIWAKDQRNATGDYPGLISKGDGVSNSFILFIVKSNGNAVLKVNNTYPCSGVVPNDGFLHNICFTKSGSTYTMYIDGIQKSQSTNINTPNNTNDFLIGKSNEQWKGSLNEPLIYNRALTQAEITQNFNATRSKYGI